MSETEPVSEAAAPKVATPKPRSSVAFPYYSLDKCIEVPRLIHERAGGRCDRAQLAGLLGYSRVKNGGFLTRITATKMFGLIDESGDTLLLTDRAKKILSPVRPSDAEQAKLDAFMAVELYRKVFEDFDGHTLPAADGLTNLFLTQYKVVPNQVAPALRNLMDSATSAGLFKVGGRTKLIRPIINGNGGPAPATQPAPAPTTADDERRDGEDSGQQARNGSRSGDGGSNTQASTNLPDVHPALAGLIQNLPPLGSTLGPKRRAALIDAFKHTINFIYPEEED